MKFKEYLTQVLVRASVIVGLATLATATSHAAPPPGPGPTPNPTPVTRYVSANTGSDANNGSVNSKFKTLKKAFSVSKIGDTVLVFAGTYNAANGEVFPLKIPVGVTVKGDEYNKGNGGGGALPIIVRGYGNDATVGVSTLIGLGANKISGLRVEAVDVGSTPPYYHKGIVLKPYHPSIVALLVGSKSTVKACTVIRNGYGITIFDGTPDSTAIISGNNTIIDNAITFNRVGVVAMRTKNNTLTGNTISNQSNYGIAIWPETNAADAFTGADCSGNTMSSNAYGNGVTCVFSPEDFNNVGCQ